MVAVGSHRHAAAAPSRLCVVSGAEGPAQFVRRQSGGAVNRHTSRRSGAAWPTLSMPMRRRDAFSGLLWLLGTSTIVLAQMGSALQQYVALARKYLTLQPLLLLPSAAPVGPARF
jgi:hypothetical protein